MFASFVCVVDRSILGPLGEQFILANLHACGGQSFTPLNFVHMLTDVISTLWISILGNHA
jgi:hypothetical protein